MRTPEEITNSFGFHPATPEVTAIYAELRATFETVAQYVAKVCPDSKEAEKALAYLENAQMWAIKSVAVHRTPLGPEGTGHRPDPSRPRPQDQPPIAVVTGGA